MTFCLSCVRVRIRIGFVTWNVSAGNVTLCHVEPQVEWAWCTYTVKSAVVRDLTPRRLEESDIFQSTLHFPIFPEDWDYKFHLKHWCIATRLHSVSCQKAVDTVRIFLTWAIQSATTQKRDLCYFKYIYYVPCTKL